MGISMERTIRIGDDGSVIEVIDHWEGMDLLGIRFGAYDGEGGISWNGGDYSALTREMGAALAKVLTTLATPTDTKPAGEGQ